MKQLIQLEELAMFLFGIYLFNQLSYSWWWFLALILTPDIGMLGYLINKEVGAITYNLFHHKAVALLLYVWGIYQTSEALQLAGVILFSHASMDRMMGYGLKTFKGFKFTHLGAIGQQPLT